MENLLNGGGKPLPAITARWDEQSQGVAPLEFDPKEFRSWDFIIMVLRSAVDQAEHCKKMQQMAQMKQAMVTQAQEQHLRQQLLGGR